MAVRGYGAPDAERIGSRVWELCNRLEPSPSGAMALSGLSSTLANVGRLPEAIEVSRKALALTQRIENRSLQVGAHHLLAFWLTWSGDLAGGDEHYRRSCDLYDAGRDFWLMDIFGEPGIEALAEHGTNTWFRGYPDQALAMAEEAVLRARRLDHAFTHCYALWAGAITVHSFRGEDQPLLGLGEELRDIAAAGDFAYFAAVGTLASGMAVGQLDDPDRGIALILEGLDAWRAIGTVLHGGALLALAARFHHLQGRIRQALALSEEALALARSSGEGLTEVFAAVTRAALVKASDAPSAEGELKTAIDAARAIGARSLELRAATELASFHEEHDRPDDARKVLEPVYTWFTEGFDTKDLIEARTVLERL
jgi:tetratricopeptide (TPR) repeat protein